MLSALKSLQRLGEAVESVDSALACNDLPRAVTEISALEQRLLGVRQAADKAATAAADPSAAAPLLSLLALVGRQCSIRRAEAKASLRALWRSAVNVDASLGMRVTPRLEGLVAGLQLETPLTLNQVLY